MATFIYPPTPPASGGATEVTLLQVEQNTADTVTELQTLNTNDFATEAKQDDIISELQDANTELDSQTAELQELNNKSASAFVSEPFDYQEITYVGATTRIDQVVYKSGGSGGTTVATLTMGYDGSDRLTSVTKS